MNAYKQLSSLTFTNYNDILEFLNGKTMRILNTKGSHSYGPIGTEFIFRKPMNPLLSIPSMVGDNETIKIPSSFGACQRVDDNLSRGNSLRTDQFLIVNFEEKKSNIISKIVSLEKQRQELDNDIDTLRGKLGFLQETGHTTYYEEEHAKFEKLSLSKKRKYVEGVNK
ncbi:hypothetical protein N356_gp030 [Cellulophaga phage phi14:2]|uniref:Uncharacterized protein n=1 Tax=Cellulophaga phage phi14:2 TaxID=1327990 RepID=S0A3A4_9CAUD|nr:hypothetical protein N356_gp030 [Cellulophaga phage phi14:2]AGO48922.1 hypothetical protein Phi14:2_gp044 [Cellulophaga phage phi14:2]